MDVIKTNIDGVLIIESRVVKYSRRYFFESSSSWIFMEGSAHISA